LVPLVAFGFNKITAAKKSDADATKDLELKQRTLNEVMRNSIDTYGKEKAELDTLIDSLKTEGLSRKDKMATLKELQDKFPGYFDNIKTEKDLNEQLAGAYEKAAQGILLKAKVQAASDMLAKNESEKLKAELDFEEAKNAAKNFYDKSVADEAGHGRAKALWFSYSNMILDAGEDYSKVVDGVDKKNKFLLDSIKDSNSEILKLGGKITGKTDPTKAANQGDKYADDILKANYEAHKLQMEQEIKFAQDYLQNDKNSFNTRLQAAQHFYDLKLQLIKDDRQFGLDDISQKEAEAVKAAEADKKGAAVIQKIHENAAAQRKLTEVKYNLDILALNDESEKMTNAMTEKNLELRKKLHEQYKTEEEAHRKSQHEIDLENLANDYQKELVKLDESFAAKKIKEKKYNEEKLRLQEEYQVAALRADIKFAQETLAISEARAKASGKQEDIDAVAAAKAKLASIQINLEGIIASFHIKKNKEQEDSDDALFKKREERLQRYATLAKEVSDVVGGFIQNNVDKEKNALQAKEDQLNKTYETEVTNINNSTLTEEQKAARLKIIEAQKLAQTEAIERRKRQLDLERARFDKAANIANIISDTALAVVRALGDKTLPAPLRIPFAIAIGAIGAANLVKAIAAPLPKFAGGTKSSPEGWALTDELGPELYRTPSGKIFFGDNQPTFRFLEKGTEIIPHDRINDVLHKKAMDSTLALIERPLKDNTASELKQMREENRWYAQQYIKALQNQKRRTVNNIKIDTSWGSYLQKQVYE
jgi:hypothetical protein